MTMKHDLLLRILVPLLHLALLPEACGPSNLRVAKDATDVMEDLAKMVLMDETDDPVLLALQDLQVHQALLDSTDVTAILDPQAHKVCLVHQAHQALG